MDIWRSGVSRPFFVFKTECYSFLFIHEYLLLAMLVLICFKKAMPNKKTIPIIVRDVDRVLWKEFRRICFEEEISATEKIKQLIFRAVKRAENRTQ